MPRKKSDSTVVLGIETSCDETAVGVVRGGTEVLANLIHSQAELHAPYGGVVPEVAGRSHLERIHPILAKALAEAGIDAADLSAVAVVNRPGLIGCLLVGVAVAKTLALAHELPLVAVDHVEAHVHAAFLAAPDLECPLLSLVASGGHTNLFVVDGPGRLEALGRSLDDAAGEALDKGAAMLGLGYPGGPAIEEAAAGGDPAAYRFPRGLLAKDSLDFSFSGLKTALLYELRGPGLSRPQPELTPRQRADLAASFQEAVVDTLVEKLARAAARHPVRTLAIGGGVARNRRLRAKIAAREELAALRLVFPPPDLCSDNGAMVAGLGTVLLARGERSGLDLDARARGAPGAPGR